MAKKRKFAVPYNHDTKLLDKLVEEFPDKKALIYEVYFPIPSQVAYSGRVIDQNDDYLLEVIELIKNAKKHNVISNILLNAGCMAENILNPESIEGIVDYLKDLHDKHGLDMVTVSDFYIGKVIKERIPTLKMECSSVVYVDSVNKAQYWADIDCNVIVIPHDFNKDMGLLRRLRENLPGTEFKLMVNHHCYNYCPMFFSHNNIEGHGDAGMVYSKLCKETHNDQPWKMYSTGYVPPKNLVDYDEVIDVYKILDRAEPTERIKARFGSYAHDEKYSQRIERMNNKIPEEIFQKVLHCDKLCTKCTACEDYYRKVNEN